jgi:signal transduction histidine kinase
LLSKESFTPEITILIEQAHRNCLFLASLVKDFTTLSQIREDSIPIKMESVDSRKVIEQLVRDFTPLIDQTKLKMHASIAPQTPDLMSTEHYIREILQNYVNNAVKYSKKGEITISAHPNRSGGVIYAVKDEGIGISASDQKHLFEKFFRSENFDTRETRGSGLGLYLCHELAARLNGKVWFESKLNVGSTFYLEVPSSSHLKRDQSEIITA